MTTVLLTSGGTKTPIDEVRHVGNMSQGTFGCHICNSLLIEGQKTMFFHAKGSKAPHEFRANLLDTEEVVAIRRLMDRYDFLRKVGNLYLPYEYHDFETYASRLLACLRSTKPDVVILAAAVSDYAPVKREGKISSELRKMVIKFEQTPKLIRQVKDICPKTFLVGFKLLVGSTQEELVRAMKKQIEKTGADMVVGNDLRDIRSNNHRLSIMYPNGNVDQFGGMQGAELADVLVKRILVRLVRKVER